MFSGMALDYVDVGEGTLRVRHGGYGPPLLLLHGHPRTHMTWGHVADLMTPRFTVICPDLRGFGQSFQPIDSEDSRHSSKRAKALDCVELMRALGYRKFGVAGHDRGSYVAYRLAMDYPEIVTKVAVIDSIPIIEHLERIDWQFARDWFHWFFFAQSEKPERAINVDPKAWYKTIRPDLMGEEAYADLMTAIHSPAVVHGMIEDYRAGLTVDRKDELQDRADGRRISCPLLCLWSTRDDLEYFFGDPREIWRLWATNVTGHGIDSGHHVAEENPADLANSLQLFFGDG
ncbi:alpha/beta fold hydrolase [Rhizobium lentis]|uniref:Haloacetate dehalogenase n=1 Tax=Rhizobium lentis TaxID=1138194 RepID=A0A7W9CYS7_9HYPH|nr:alpha/beta hydrolase [Rhizobium lentis]MBB5554137.1 haloacetate dehalogenase [Rhizobium lentis]MBB5564750.1 haloacetate dehalogenase [Rhizobium lentis]MBB5571233.1 haloacetate dehalogenase [Rhizobium lentis]